MAAVAAILVAAMGLIFGVGFDLHPIGVILTAVGLIGGIVLTFMALGDRRAGPALPICAAVAGAVGLVVALMANVDTDDDSLISDNVDDVPEDPAEIIE